MNTLRRYLKQLKKMLLQEFSSMRLAITLFLLLAITTLIGTILPEEPMVGKVELIKRYGMHKYQILKSLGLTDVFHSWWYLALLTALWINLIVASFKRVFPKYVRAFAFPVDLKTDSVKKLPINSEFPANDFKLQDLEIKLRKRRYKTSLMDGKLLAVKGGWHRLGASVTHVGILTLLVGSLISTLCGFNGMAQVSEDEGFYVADLRQNTDQIRTSEKGIWLAPISRMPIWFGRLPPYLVKVNKTWRDDYKTGQPKQWYSDLSVFDENKNELIRKTIFVNNPLEFMGLDVYQSNWGKFVEISFNNERATIPLENFNGEELVFLPLSSDIGLKLKVIQSSVSTLQAETKDKLELSSVSVLDPSKEKFLGLVNRNQQLQLGPILVGYFGTQTLTGLQFKSNPGNFLIYPGLCIIIFGVLIAFGSRKQIWAHLISNKIIIGGKSDRAKGKFYKEFEDLVKEVINT